MDFELAHDPSATTVTTQPRTLGMAAFHTVFEATEPIRAYGSPTFVLSPDEFTMPTSTAPNSHSSHPQTRRLRTKWAAFICTGLVVFIGFVVTKANADQEVLKSKAIYTSPWKKSNSNLEMRDYIELTAKAVGAERQNASDQSMP